MTIQRRFEFVEGTSNQFWEVLLDGSSVTTRWGRIGSEGQSTIQDEGASEAAQKLCERLVRQKLKEGYIEVGVKPAAQPEEKPQKKKPASKAKKADAAPGPLASKSFEDVREVTLAIEDGSDNPTWCEYLIEAPTGRALVRWARGASAGDVQRWVKGFAPPFRAWMLGVVAADQARLGQRDVSKELVREAEALHANPGPYIEAHFLRGLVPAWWRLGEEEKARAGFERLVKEMEDRDFGTLITVAVQGGRYEEAMKLVPRAFEDGNEQGLYAALAVALEDGEMKLFDLLLERWAEVGEPSRAPQEFAFTLLAALRDDPARFVEFALARPKFLADPEVLSAALHLVEQRDQKAAVSLALKTLDMAEPNTDPVALAVAVLAAHAPERVARWKKPSDAKFKALEGEAFFGDDLAALGRHDEARTALAQIRSDSYSSANGIALLTTDRALAAEALLDTLKKTPHSMWAIVRLRELGRRAEIDATLETLRTAAEAASGEKRLARAQELAQAAGAAGRHEVAEAALKLVPPKRRDLVAEDWALGAAHAGDHAGALAALERIADRRSKLSAAIQRVLGTAERAWALGPRAVPLRSLMSPEGS